MWIKLGLIFKDWAQLPTVQQIDGGVRVYYSQRCDGQSSIYYFETDDPIKAKHINKKPVFTKGKRGCFDDRGVMPSCVHKDNFFYTGWNVDKGEVPYGHGIGCAVVVRDRIERISDGPVLDRTLHTPFLVNSPFVDDRGMLFCNGTGWKEDFPTYQIASAKIDKGRWQFEKVLFGNGDEACSRPCRFKNNIYFAKKKKNTKYTITNEVGTLVLGPSEYGWDSEMICYPMVFKFQGEWYMYYNGNGFGATGVGVARWEE